MDGDPHPGSPPHVVLLAEDDPIIRMLAVDVLGDAGFTVIEAVHAEQALALLTARAASIHVLFTDIQMPGALDGLALARHASGCWPWIGILIASGNARPEPADLPRGSRFLAKPYEAAVVLEHVRELARAC